MFDVKKYQSQVTESLQELEIIFNREDMTKEQADEVLDGLIAHSEDQINGANQFIIETNKYIEEAKKLFGIAFK